MYWLVQLGIDRKLTGTEAFWTLSILHRQRYVLGFIKVSWIFGGVAERSKAPVLKTGDVNSVLGFESLPLRHYIVVKRCYLTFFLLGL